MKRACLAVWLMLATAFAEVDPKDRLVVETIQRLESFQYANASAKIKDAVGRYLKATEGTQEFLDLIERFQIRDQAAALEALALQKPADSLGIKAVTLLVSAGEFERLSTMLTAAKPEVATQFVQAIGHGSGPKLASYLFDLAKNETPAAEVRRAAITAMANKPDGVTELLSRIKQQELPADLHLAAGNVLFASADPAVVKEAEQLLPRPQSANQQPLPPVAELAKKTGDAANGAAVYDRVCIACHKVDDKGIDYGPGLSEIGSKLAREALYAAILDPSAAISFGYEGWLMKLKDGGETLGFIAGETDAEVTLKMPGGILTKYPKGQITQREKMALSLMPANLQATMTEQELIDLAEYLAGLKAKK